jgi:hypothetical protein
MDGNEPRVSGTDTGGLRLVPTVARPAKNEMKACAGEFLLKIRLTPVVLDLRVRKPIPSLRADWKPRLAFGDRGTVTVPNPKLRYEMKEVRPKPAGPEDAREYACDHDAPEPCGEASSRDGSREQGKCAIGVPEQPAPDWPALRLVGIEQCLDRPAPDHERQPPREVPGVLNACIHSLCADRTVNVRRVAGEKNAASTVVRGLAMMQPEVTEPRRIAQGESSPRRVIDDLLQLLEREIARVGSLS